jgi:P pilus assembly chaperone PapD
MVTIKNIIPRKQASATQTVQYTANNCKCIIDKFTVTNTSPANVTFSVNLVAFGDSPTDANLVLKAKTVVPNETYTCPELVGQVLEAGGIISTIAGVAASLTISASGREVT